MKTPLLFILTILFLLPFSGCKKYEEGPLLSFRSPENRIEGRWDIDKLLINEADSTDILDCLTISFHISNGEDGEGRDFYILSSCKNFNCSSCYVPFWCFKTNEVVRNNTVHYIEDYTKLMVGLVYDSDLTVYYAPFHTQNNEWLKKN